MKRPVGLLAALAMAAAVIATPGVAQAAPRKELYAVVQSNGAALTSWFWIDELQGIIGCAKCAWQIDFRKTVVLTADQEKLFQASFLAGVTKLSEASVADPRTAAVLRSQATDQFAAAARSLGAGRALPGVVGYYDPDRQATIPSSQPWLQAADQDFADGLTLMQRAAGEPVPVPWITRAMAEFDEAFAELSGKRVIG
ncbi:hypothetical protein F4553_002478 [Allocatelliglobosispora scoriae]|uniref:Uncharacterized protein n=1 Tax=Allocatelliglobosispora scoriae TaxID=643052 RepID=A0A841BPI5_9ACTN|nr:hypothetical protein [Allocatelliglobosispora scoriae]MBB5869099.1 hypothetical protein [Allocatelliglobosispora scoriae]